MFGTHSCPRTRTDKQCTLHKHYASGHTTCGRDTISTDVDKETLHGTPDAGRFEAERSSRPMLRSKGHMLTAANITVTNNL